MTFRVRLVLAATAAVLVVVVLGSLVTYIVAYNSLVGSVDVTLSTDVHTVLSSQSTPTIPNSCPTAGNCSQIVGPNGTTDTEAGTLVLPVTDAVKSSASSQGRAEDIFASTTLSNGVDVRQVVAALPPGYEFNDGTQYVQLEFGGALQISAPLTGVNAELRHLALALWLIVLVGITLAVLLGLGVGRTVLRPLNSLTRTVEELAETTDVSRRLDPGGPDELGRLRRAFNRLLVALDTSRESQRQLVLDASHELRTPLTSLRTNMEVARRLEELAPEEREVLIGDVLTQLDELTSLVADLAELARGEQPQLTTETIRLDSIVLEAVEVATTHGRSRRRDLRCPGAADLGLRVHGPHRSGHRQPARQRPQVEPGRRGGRGGLRRGDACSSGTMGPGSTPATSTSSSTASTGPRVPGAGPDRAWAWPSWPRWPGTRAAA